MLEIVISIAVGMLIALVSVAAGACFCLYYFRKGAMLTDNIYREKAPFDEKLKNEQPFDSHVDGEYLDEDEEKK